MENKELDRKNEMDNYFAEEVNNVCKEVKESRKNRHEKLKPGMRFIRNGYDIVEEQTNWDSAFFLVHIQSIVDKTSKLPSNVRKVIKDVCGEAMNRTVKHFYEIENQNK